MNGIIHGASHPPSVDLLDGGGLSDKDMFMGIMHYLNRIVDIVKPNQSIYMAIDGVAPRAKMNQQRSRRFRSAKDMADEKQSRLEKGEVLQEREGGGGVFDSNCITPGTHFMRKVRGKSGTFY